MHASINAPMTLPIVGALSGLPVPDWYWDARFGALPPGASFSRAGGATQIASDGTLKWAPENLVAASNNFTGTGWGTQVGSAGVAPVITAGFAPGPDGVAGAATRIQFALNAPISDDISVVNHNGTFVGRREIKIWAKLNTGTSHQMYFRVATATTAVTVTNVWQQFTLTESAMSSDGNGLQMGLRAGATGNGPDTLDVLVAYAQMHRVPNVSTAYVATTNGAYYGPRFYYDQSTLASWGVLEGMQSTNSIRNNTMVGASAGTPGTLPTNWVNNGSNGTTISVVGTGIENGISYIDVRWSGTPSSSGDNRLGFEGATSIAALTGQSWGTSAFVRVSAGSLTNIGNVFFAVSERTAAGAGVQTDSGTSFKASLGASLFRASYQATLSGGGTVAFADPEFRFSVTSGSAIDVTFRIGLPQFEGGGVGTTSPILTVSATVTRAQDILSLPLTSIPGWTASKGGVLVATYRTHTLVPSAPGYNQGIVYLNDGTTANAVVMHAQINGGGGFGGSVGNLVGTANTINTGSAAVPFVRRKQAMGWDANRLKIAYDGTSLGLATGVVPLPTGMTTMYLGSYGTSNLNGTLESIAYYAGARSDAFVQAVSQ